MGIDDDDDDLPPEFGLASGAVGGGLADEDVPPVAAVPAKPKPRPKPVNTTIYGRVLARFAPGGLDAARDAEINFLLASGVSEDDPFWTWFLPLFLTQPRGEQAKIDGQAMLDLVKVQRGARIDPGALGEAVAEHLADKLPAHPDAIVLAGRIAKAMAGDIRKAVAEGAEAVDKSGGQGALREAAKDALVNRHLIIAVLAGILMAMAGVWWGGYQSDQRWEPLVKQLQSQLRPATR